MIIFSWWQIFIFKLIIVYVLENYKIIEWYNFDMNKILKMTTQNLNLGRRCNIWAEIRCVCPAFCACLFYLFWPTVFVTMVRMWLNGWRVMWLSRSGLLLWQETDKFKAWHLTAFLVSLKLAYGLYGVQSLLCWWWYSIPLLTPGLPPDLPLG